MRSPLFLLVALVTPNAALCSCGADDPVDSTARSDTLRAEELAPPRIERISMSGSGCPDPDGLFLTGNRESFFVRLEAFLATVSPQVPKADAECTISLTLEGVDGVAYAPAGLDARLTTDSNSQVSVSTRGSWMVTADASARSWSANETQVNTHGRLATRKLFDEPGLVSACSGSRELTMTTKLQIQGQAGHSGYAAIRALSNLRFYAKSCADGGVDGGLDAGADGSIDAGVGPDSGRESPDGSVLGSTLIDRVQVLGGYGCPTNSLTVTVAEDRSTFAVDFGQFTARDAELPACVFAVSLSPPPGYRADVASYVLEGQTRLAAGSQAKVIGRFVYADEVGPSLSGAVAFDGPRAGEYRADVSFPPSRSITACRPGAPLLELHALVTSDAADPEPPLEIRRLGEVRFRLRPCL